MTDIEPGQVWRCCDRMDERFVKVLSTSEDWIRMQECDQSGNLKAFTQPHNALRKRFEHGSPKGGYIPLQAWKDLRDG